MNRKFKISLLILSILALIIAIPLIILSFGRVNVDSIALSYDNIIANYSSEDVYGPGLHFIGVARQFVRIKRIPTALSIPVQTYTSDYFKLKSQLIVAYQLTTLDNFTTVNDFYINFGQNAQQIIRSVVTKKITSLMSQFPTTYYKKNFVTSDFQSTITSSLTNLFLNDLGVSLTVNTLIESLIVEGASSNTESITRQIEHALRQLQRSQTQKINLSNFIQRIKQKSLQQMKIAYQIIKQRTDILAGLIDQYGSGSISKILFGNQIFSNNISFSSSQAKLRPQLYSINSTAF